MDSTALPLHLPTSWGEWSYQSSDPPSRREMSSISVNRDSALGSMPFLCHALYFSSDSLSTWLCQLLWPWQSCCSPVMCDAQHLFAIWVSVFCEWIMFVSVPLNICIQHPCIICQWGCSPGGEDDSYLCVCVCLCYQMVHLVRRCGRRILTPPVMITV